MKRRSCEQLRFCYCRASPNYQSSTSKTGSWYEAYVIFSEFETIHHCWISPLSLSCSCGWSRFNFSNLRFSEQLIRFFFCQLLWNYKCSLIFICTCSKVLLWNSIHCKPIVGWLYNSGWSHLSSKWKVSVLISSTILSVPGQYTKPPITPITHQSCSSP